MSLMVRYILILELFKSEKNVPLDQWNMILANGILPTPTPDEIDRWLILKE